MSSKSFNSTKNEQLSALGFGTSNDDQYIVFGLGTELYGVPVLKVQEIISYTPPTTIPNAPVFVRGVINLRGMVIPIIDMRLRFGLEEQEYHDKTVVVVVTIGERRYGLVVDTVEDVASLPEEQIQRDVDLQTNIDERYLTGIGKLEDRMIILLDVDKIFTRGELETLKTATA